MELMETCGLCYSYQNQLALDRVDFKIRRGQVTALLGGNGAGKSTLFLQLNGVLQPDKGTVFYEGEPIRYDSKSLQALCRRVGLLFQDPNDQLFSDSVRNDMAIGLLNQKIAQPEAAARVEAMAEQLDIVHLLDRPTHALSFGQKKRVALAGVLVMRPTILVLDEPTAGLDPAGSHGILTLLNDIQKKSGVSLVLATHDVDLVALYADYAYVLDAGKMVLEGTPKELFAQTKALRMHHLRTPRLTHLMEILHKRDGLGVDCTAASISEVRRTIKELL